MRGRVEISQVFRGTSHQLLVLSRAHFKWESLDSRDFVPPVHFHSFRHSSCAGPCTAHPGLRSSAEAATFARRAFPLSSAPSY